MATQRIASPWREVSLGLRRSARKVEFRSTCTNSSVRRITTSAAQSADVLPITTSANDFTPVKPFSEQTVQATIHRFPTLEPVDLKEYPANHLYLPTRRDILHRAVIYEGDKSRKGTASTLTRWEVRGSSRKIRPQKGTGRARLGDKKSPMLHGGGVSHGPKPRDFSTELPKKVYDLAWRTALSYRYRRGELIIVDNAIEIESPSTIVLKNIFGLHEQTRGTGRSLLIAHQPRPMLEMALDAMDRRQQYRTWEDVDVKDLLELSRIIIEQQALHQIFRSHRSDLPQETPQSWRIPLLTTRQPAILEEIPGWKAFRTIMQTPAAERDGMRAQLYADVADERWQNATSAPPDLQTPAKISAYNLLAESKQLIRKGLPTNQSLEAAFEESKRQAGFGTITQATVDAAAAEVRWRENEAQGLLLDAQVAEHRRDAHSLQVEAALAAGTVSQGSEQVVGIDHKAQAEELHRMAGEHRGKLLEADTHVARAKKELAYANAELAEEEEDEAAAQEFREEAENMADEEQRLVDEAEEQKRLAAETLTGTEDPESPTEVEVAPLVEEIEAKRDVKDEQTAGYVEQTVEHVEERAELTELTANVVEQEAKQEVEPADPPPRNQDVERPLPVEQKSESPPTPPTGLKKKKKA